MLTPLFNPRSVAVIGASNRKLTIGYRIVQNLINSEFQGPVFPVHPKAKFIKNLPAYPTIEDVPYDVDVAHIVLKNTLVPSVVEQCGKKGVKVVIINSAGFKEMGGDGIELEKQVLEVARKYNVRVFGPNCQGVMNSDPEVRAYCNFTFTPLAQGKVSLFAQSGGVGEVINNRLFELGAGVRMYASNGNAADVDVCDILEYWAEDEGTRVIILHIESLSDPQRFLEVAKKATSRKPVLGMKSGRTALGARAVSSHTGGMIKQDTTTELIFKKAGIVSISNEDEMCQAALALANQPAAKGKRIGIVTNTGGPGIIVTDEVIEAGCTLPDLEESRQKDLKEKLFAEAIVSNPIDVIATAGPEQYRAATEALIEDPNIDIAVINFITPFFVDTEGVAREIVDLASKADKPVLPVVMTNKQGWQKTLSIFQDASIPVFDLPETAGRVASIFAKHGDLATRPVEEVPELDGIDKAAAEKILSGKTGYLSQPETFGLLDAYGIPSVPYGGAKNADEAAKVAGDIGFPVALKVDSQDVVHKSDEGGIVLNLADEAAVKTAAEGLADKFKGANLFVQKQAGPGTELIIGAVKDAPAGHVVMFGLGGIFVEAIEDVTFELAPLTHGEAVAMLEDIKGCAILQGTRGKPPVDKKAIVDVLLRLSTLVTDFPKIAELDMNPVFAYAEGKGAVIVDARVRVDK
ncbi:MAG: acetate--CoA ligase family protein [Deltaproteobacteria bacterium]|nr:acetate--CoA ligase family protein [Deltaproteobacteria bacterium]